MAVTGKSFGALPLGITNPSKYGAQSTDVFDVMRRPLQWDGDPMDENMQQKENDAALYTLLTKLARKMNAWNNPTMWWRIENRLNMFTSLIAAATASDTYLAVGEASILKTGYQIFVPQTGEQILVLDTDPSFANGWTNGAGDACNVKVDRTFMPGPKVAASVGFEVRAGVPMMGEFGEPKEGVITVPGDPQYNFIQLFGMYIKMSRMQKASLMDGDYGTHEHLVMENESYLAQQLQNTLLFQNRGTKESSEGQVFWTNGLIPQVQDNVLSAGSNGNTLTFANVSDFIDRTHESANSSASKIVAAGEQLYMNLLNTARQEAMLVDAPHYNPSLGVDEFSFNTGGGKTVAVEKMRFAFQGTLKDWGLVLDLANIATGEYEDFGFKWYMDLDNPMQNITTKTDAMVGSIAVTVRDPSTCGVIKGGVAPVLENRNGLGIVKNA